MAVIPPSTERIRTAIPSISDLEFLNAGGFKAVFKANINGQWEALKLIELPDLGARDSEEKARDYAELRSRVSREINILGKIKSPEIVKLGTMQLSEIVIDDKEYLVYSEELINGTDLMQIISSNGERPTETELRVLCVSILRVIKELWAHGYIHRDIKPANIMKTGKVDRPFIMMDLGIAFSTNETGITNNSAAIPATLKYIAPEMLTRDFRQTIDYRSDLYAAGLTLYEYAAFRHPLARDADDMGSTLYNALKKSPKTLKMYRQDLGSQFCSRVDQLLKKKPALRPSNIDMLISQMGESL